ncbi:MAG: helix-turn-helix transcriptional regulator [Chloroflexi bacterium]|nr:helix-turn-helix transcriptional regulator [Chloroflexota bacterium]
MTIQLIKRNGEPEWAVLPYEQYLQLVEKAELLQDIQDYDSIKTALERGEEELIPAEVLNAVLAGENPIRVWREYRGLSQSVLAEKTDISVPYLSQLESKKRKGSLKVLSTIAQGLGIPLDLILID